MGGGIVLFFLDSPFHTDRFRRHLVGCILAVQEFCLLLSLEIATSELLQSSRSFWWRHADLRRTGYYN